MTVTVLLLSALWVGVIAQNYAPDDIFFTTQAQVDALAASNCKSVVGYLIISGLDISDLSGLSHLVTIGGGLQIFGNSLLPSLAGLSSIKSVGGSLILQDNDRLTNLDELQNLRSVSSELTIQTNNQLKQIDGLSNLTSVGGGLYIE